MSDDLGEKLLALSCPVPVSDYPNILLGHGGGGRLSQMLVERMFAASFDNAALSEMHDGAVLPVPAGRLAFSTDSFVVRPYFFPGGDIGSLAVHGTVNDLAMCGARPLALSAALILEEGLPMEDLWRIVRSMADAARAAGVSIVTGDTKVVDRGKGDGVFVNISGVGLVPAGVEISPRRARPGDVILVSGAIAQHGIAIMSVREGLEFETALASDSAPLNGLVATLLEASASTSTSCATRRGAASPRSSTRSRRRPASASRSPRRRSRRRGGARGVRDPRARPSLRRQRGEAPRVRRPASGRRGARRLRAHRSARRRRSSAR